MTPKPTTKERTVSQATAHSTNNSPHYTTRIVLPESVSQVEQSAYIGEGDGITFTERKVKLNQEIADRHLSLPSLEYERRLDNNHVAYLMNCMKRGTFRAEQCNLSTCVFDGVEYRTNGQHTCWARTLLEDGDYEPEIRLIKYRADNEEQIRDLYATTDRALPRTKGHVVVARLYETEEFDGISKDTIKRLSEGLGVWLWESQTERKRHDADDRAQRLKTEHNGLAIAVARFLTANGKNSETKHLYRGPCIGAMFATFDKNQQRASEFWEVVRTGIGVTERGDPRHSLRNNLLSASVSLGPGTLTGKKSASQEEMYRWCVLAWNAWRKGESLKVFRPMMANPRPKVRS